MKIPVKIPKGFRIAAATCLSDAIDHALSSDSWESWLILICFAPVALGIPTKESEDNIKETNSRLNLSGKLKRK